MSCSSLANASHPWGRIPSICHDGFWLFESQAIARYLDATFAPALLPTDAKQGAVVDSWVSSISDYFFTPAEHGVIKKRAALVTEHTTEAEISAAIAPGVAATKLSLANLEAMTVKASASGPFLLGFALAPAFRVLF